MSEKMVTVEQSPDYLVQKVYAVRERMNEQKRFDLMDAIVDFDKKLKKDVTELYGSTKVLQEVSAWQALVGGSIEPEVTITPEQKEFIDERISSFVDVLEEQLQ